MGCESVQCKEHPIINIVKRSAQHNYRLFGAVGSDNIPTPTELIRDISVSGCIKILESRTLAMASCC